MVHIIYARNLATLGDRVRLVFAALVVLGHSSLTLARPQCAVSCLSYDPAVVQISGTLLRQTFPGPPNYESVSKGDVAETYWLIQLDRPICVNQDKSEPDLGPAQKNLRKIQLVVEPAIYAGYKGLIGKRVVAKGKFFGAISGHHHTPVLLTVSELSKQGE